MPAVMHESIAFLTSSLGGSSIPTFKTRGKQINSKKKPGRKPQPSNKNTTDEFKEGAPTKQRSINENQCNNEISQIIQIIVLTVAMDIIYIPNDFKDVKVSKDQCYPLIQLITLTSNANC